MPPGLTPALKGSKSKTLNAALKRRSFTDLAAFTRTWRPLAELSRWWRHPRGPTSPFFHVTALLDTILRTSVEERAFRLASESLHVWWASAPAGLALSTTRLLLSSMDMLLDEAIVLRERDSS